jgi:hypothetical protein
VARKADIRSPLATAPQGALFLLRAERSEAGFLRQHGAQMHGAILLARHLVRHADDVASTDLGRAARETRIPHHHDPDTFVLAWHQGTEDKRFGRTAEMPCAQLVDLPLQPGSLEADQALEEFVRATLSTQISVTDPAPPYFRFDSIDDPWLELSLRSAATARRLLGSRRLAIFVSASLAALRSGALAAAAARYREVLPDGALLFLGVAGLHSIESEAEDLAAYVSAANAFSEQGFELIADRVGRFGAAVVAAGARGYCAGTRVYRHTPPSPDWNSERSIKVLTHYEAAQRGDRIPRQDVVRRLRRGSIPPCPDSECPVSDPVTVPDLRWHSIHLQQLEVGEAEQKGLTAWAELWAASPRNYVRAWAEALRLVDQARKAA